MYTDYLRDFLYFGVEFFYKKERVIIETNISDKISFIEKTLNSLSDYIDRAVSDLLYHNKSEIYIAFIKERDGYFHFYNQKGYESIDDKTKEVLSSNKAVVKSNKITKQTFKILKKIYYMNQLPTDIVNISQLKTFSFDEYKKLIEMKYLKLTKKCGEITRLYTFSFPITDHYIILRAIRGKETKISILKHILASINYFFDKNLKEDLYFRLKFDEDYISEIEKVRSSINDIKYDFLEGNKVVLDLKV